MQLGICAVMHSPRTFRHDGSRALDETRPTLRPKVCRTPPAVSRRARIPCTSQNANHGDSPSVERGWWLFWSRTWHVRHVEILDGVIRPAVHLMPFQRSRQCDCPLSARQHVLLDQDRNTYPKQRIYIYIFVCVHLTFFGNIFGV